MRKGQLNVYPAGEGTHRVILDIWRADESLQFSKSYNLFTLVFNFCLSHAQDSAV